MSEDIIQSQPAGVYGTPEQVAKLYAALSRVQAALDGAKKDKTNPAFKSTYADLASVWEACRDPLTANGFAVIQRTQAFPTSPALAGVTTILAHEGGASITSELFLPFGGTPQQAGSAITYARRYSLAAIVGVCPEDDDGNAAEQGAQEAIRRAVDAPPRPQPGEQPKTDDEKRAAAGRRLYAVMNAHNISKDLAHAVATAALKREVTSIADLSAQERHAVADWIEKSPPEVVAAVIDDAAFA